MKTKPLSGKQQIMIEALATFKYLSASQAIRCKVANNSTNLSRVVKPLRKEGYLSHFANVIAGKGKQEHVYYLLRKGASLLSGNPGAQRIRYPKSAQPLLANDRNHRLRTVDIFFWIHQYVKHHGLLSEITTYYDFSRAQTKGGQPACDARLPFTNSIGQEQIVIPDLIIVTHHETLARICLVEAAVTPDLGHIFHGISGHIELIRSRSTSVTLGLGRHIDPRVLFVFEGTEIRDRVRSIFLARKEISSFSPYFLFATYEELASDLKSCWMTADGNRIDPFGIHEGWTKMDFEKTE